MSHTSNGLGFTLKRLFAVIAVVFLGTSMLFVNSAPAANALPEDVFTNSLVYPNGSAVEPGTVVDAGTKLCMRTQYQKQTGEDDLTGKTINVAFSDTVVVDSPPAGNDAVQSVQNAGNGFDIKFKDPWPEGINQGILDLCFTVEDVDVSGEVDVEWQLETREGSFQIIVKKDGDEPANITEQKFDKSASPTNLNSYVKTKDVSGDIVFDTLDVGIIGQEVEYTLLVEMPAGVDASNFKISDALPVGLSYVAGSFATKLTQWDIDGLNKTVQDPGPNFVLDPITGGSFSGTVDLGNPTLPSILEIKYKTTVVNESERQLLEEALRAQFNALDGKAGNFKIELPNIAKFGPTEVEKTATVTLAGTIPGPCTVGCSGAAFAKTGSGANINVIANEEGEIVDEQGSPSPVDVLYTLKANLNQWDDRNNNFKLDRNVVISDTLGSQLAWNTSESNFLTVTAGSGSAVTSLDEIVCPAGAESGVSLTAATTFFNDDSYVGKYCVDGQRILINIGKDKTTDVTVALKATLHSVQGLAPSGSSSILGATRYVLPNQAQFWHREGARANASTNQYPVKLPDDRDAGLNDSDVFVKSGPDGALSVEPGTRAMVPYRFVVNTDKAGINVEDLRIVDEVDTDIFDMSDLDLVQVSSTYNGVNITDQVVLNYADGELEITLASGVALEEGKQWIVDLELPTYVLEGKKTLDVSNYASLYGISSDPQNWSDAESRATSFGDELETRKHLYDREGEVWTQDLVAAIDEDGNMIENTYVYRLQLIAHGSFAGAILAIEDVLPDGMRFLGFVDEDDVAAALNPTQGPADLGNGVGAVYDPATNTITVAQETGNVPAGSETEAFFAVEIDPETFAAVINNFGGSKATIYPGGPSIDIEKWIDEGVLPEYDEHGRLLNDGFLGDFDSAPGKELPAEEEHTINFTVSNDGPEPLVNIEVSDRLVSGVGEVKDLVCVFPDETTGTSWEGVFLPAAQFDCVGSLPELAAGDTHEDLVSVTAIGQFTEIGVEDSDSFHAYVAPLVVDEGLEEDEESAELDLGAVDRGQSEGAKLAKTGGVLLGGSMVLAGFAIVLGSALLLRKRANS